MYAMLIVSFQRCAYLRLWIHLEVLEYIVYFCYESRINLLRIKCSYAWWDQQNHLLNIVFIVVSACLICPWIVLFTVRLAPNAKSKICLNHSPAAWLHQQMIHFSLALALARLRSLRPFVAFRRQVRHRWRQLRWVEWPTHLPSGCLSSWCCWLLPHRELAR